MNRTLDLEAWGAAQIPLLRDPRSLVADLHRLHLPPPGTAVIGVLDPSHRLVGSASFTPRPSSSDGWQRRNAILVHLRRVVPHDLRRATPSRTAVLLVSRAGDPGWTPEDGAWMWGLRDAAGLHGLRCGSYLTLTPQGWQVLGDGRSGRSPHAGSWAYGAPPVGSTPASADGESDWTRGPVEPLRRTAAR
ncbi:hypothetical protein [Peterkaempfera sp. SMS 1(5)a]|uniref:hypothetical protein n=1 Tax=Peterkaempfera podocarpi TaxID=3232308 RepID=UPI00366B2A54